MPGKVHCFDFYVVFDVHQPLPVTSTVTNRRRNCFELCLNSISHCWRLVSCCACCPDCANPAPITPDSFLIQNISCMLWFTRSFELLRYQRRAFSISDLAIRHRGFFSRFSHSGHLSVARQKLMKQNPFKERKSNYRSILY